MNEREIFLNAAIGAGCPEEQTRNFVAAKLWLQERQLAASAAARCSGSSPSRICSGSTPASSHRRLTALRVR